MHMRRARPHRKRNTGHGNWSHYNRWYGLILEYTAESVAFKCRYVKEMGWIRLRASSSNYGRDLAKCYFMCFVVQVCGTGIM